MRTTRATISDGPREERLIDQAALQWTGDSQSLQPLVVSTGNTREMLDVSSHSHPELHFVGKILLDASDDMAANCDIGIASKAPDETCGDVVR